MAKGIELLEASAHTGYSAALNTLGSHFENGTFAPRDCKKAYEYYFAAAAKKETTAMANLASLYCRGEGVTKNLYKARSWLQRALDNGNMGCMAALQEVNKMIKEEDMSLEEMGVIQWEKANGTYDEAGDLSADERMRRYLSAKSPRKK